MRVLLTVTAVPLLIGVALPRLVGTTLPAIGGALGTLHPLDLVLLTLLWAAGLLAHSFVLTGALPGLSRRRALTLNLTGSAVSNVLPLGGAAGVSLNYAMLRRWRVSMADFTAFTLVTNVWNILLKLALPPVALVVLLGTGTRVTHGLRWTAAAAAVALFALVAVLVTVLVSRRLCVALASLLARAWTRVGGWLGREPDQVQVREWLLECRDVVSAVVVRGWAQLSWGMAGYSVLQALLLWACVTVVGGHLTPVQVLAGYAVERVLTLAVLTPGATGITEVGTAAALVALGGSPVEVAAGVLLFRGFTFALEIPVGGAWLGGWLMMRRYAARTASAVGG